MLTGVVEGATRQLGAPTGVSDSDCGVLHIRDVASPLGNQMVSCWHPTPREITLLAGGAKVYLFIYGSAHPMVALAVGTHLVDPDSDAQT